MEGLNPTLRQLVEAAKHAARPADADCVRVFNAIQARLALVGDVVVAAPGSTSSVDHIGNPVTLTAMVKSVGTAIIIVGIALVGWLVTEPMGSREPPLAMSVSTTARESEVPTESEPPQRQVTSPTSTTDIGSRGNRPESSAGALVQRAPKKTRDRLAEEVETLSLAERELYRGRPERALSLLNEHEQNFKTGIMSEERTAARIHALCLLNRHKEADALFEKLSTSSLYRKSARRACVIAKSVSTER